MGQEVVSVFSMVSVDAREVLVETDGLKLPGTLSVPEPLLGVVLFAHGSGSSRLSPRNRMVANHLARAGLGTLLFDLLEQEEAQDRSAVFDIELLAGRLTGAARWVDRRLPMTPLGYFGASTGAGAALWSAAELGGRVDAVVSRGGRPDLAASRLPRVTAPTLLLVGGNDPVVLDLNRRAQHAMRCPALLEVIPGATHLFEEPGALEKVAELATRWFRAHLGGLTED